MKNLTLGTPLYAIHRVWAVLLHIGLGTRLPASESKSAPKKEPEDKNLKMCQFSESGAPSLGSQHGMKFAYSALEGALPAIVDEVPLL